MARTADSTSSTDETTRKPAAAPDGVPLGRVVGAHGLRGEIRVRAGGDDLIQLACVPSVRLVREGGGAGNEHTVESVRPGRAGECRVALAGISDRDAALALRGCTLFARSRDLPALREGEYYAYELVGCAAFDVAGRALGVVISILEAGASDVLLIEDAAGAVRMVPAVEPLLARVDLAARRILLDLPPGLADGEAGGGAGS